MSGTPPPISLSHGVAMCFVMRQRADNARRFSGPCRSGFTLGDRVDMLGRDAPDESARCGQERSGNRPRPTPTPRRSWTGQGQIVRRRGEQTPLCTINTACSDRFRIALSYHEPRYLHNRTVIGSATKVSKTCPPFGREFCKPVVDLPQSRFCTAAVRAQLDAHDAGQSVIPAASRQTFYPSRGA